MQLVLSNSLITGEQAFKGLSAIIKDQRVSRANVLMMKMHRFERYFVFIADDSDELAAASLDQQVKAGEKVLATFLKTLRHVVTCISLEDRQLHGQLPSVAAMKKPEPYQIEDG